MQTTADRSKTSVSEFAHKILQYGGPDLAEQYSNPCNVSALHASYIASPLHLAFPSAPPTFL